MRHSIRPIRVLLFLALFAFAGCEDCNKDIRSKYEGGDAGPASGLDRPELPRPPSTGLPDELRPPR